MLQVLEDGQPISFAFQAMLDYSGPRSPGGVAHAYKVLECALPLLAPAELAERRELTIATAFGGPGARDGFELVTRAVSDGRYTIDAALARPERGPALERFVFCLGYRGRTVTLQVGEGLVPEELIELTRADELSSQAQARLNELKHSMAARLMATPADRAYQSVQPRQATGRR
ncbi:MAG: hypothetical protein NVSMB51_20160 [Solirubrobacteraceae bacterium]